MAKKNTNWQKKGTQTAKGKKTGTVLVNVETGERKVLLTPHGRYKKAVIELKTGKRFTNDGSVKKDRNGNDMKLTPCQRAYRAGQRSMVIEQTKAHNAVNGQPKQRLGTSSRDRW